MRFVENKKTLKITNHILQGKDKYRQTRLLGEIRVKQNNRKWLSTQEQCIKVLCLNFTQKPWEFNACFPLSKITKDTATLFGMMQTMADLSLLDNLTNVLLGTAGTSLLCSDCWSLAHQRILFAKGNFAPSAPAAIHPLLWEANKMYQSHPCAHSSYTSSAF